jgi:hypothetical protein
MFAALAGFAAGLLHVLAGPDHLVAVAPFAAAGGPGQWRAGLRWGLGHTTGVLLIGLLMIGLRGVLPIDALSAYSERLVGIVLIGVGVWAFLRARAVQPSHQHVQAGASFGVGVLHGLAGSSHLFGVLPALALPTPIDALFYLGGFGIAAIVGMTAFASIMSAIAMSAACRGAGGSRHLLYACSASALVVGGYWLVG